MARSKGPADPLASSVEILLRGRRPLRACPLPLFCSVFSQPSVSFPPLPSRSASNRYRRFSFSASFFESIESVAPSRLRCALVARSRPGSSRFACSDRSRFCLEPVSGPGSLEHFQAYRTVRTTDRAPDRIRPSARDRRCSSRKRRGESSPSADLPASSHRHRTSPRSRVVNWNSTLHRRTASR